MSANKHRFDLEDGRIVYTMAPLKVFGNKFVFDERIVNLKSQVIGLKNTLSEVCDEIAKLIDDGCLSANNETIDKMNHLFEIADAHLNND